MSRLDAIVARKRVENRRRARFAHLYESDSRARPIELRRSDALKVIAEIKYRSPSAGAIRPWAPGDEGVVARAYEAGGASAISVLADGPGFGGTPLRVRRVAQDTALPVLYKGFILEPLQLDVARAMGASMVLLIVRSLNDEALHALTSAALARGLTPVVEAADGAELARALTVDPRAIVGVNARNLHTFNVDMNMARELVASIPAGRIAVQMSGVRSVDDFHEVAKGRADAVLIGEGLMRASDPAETLRSWRL
ncbi:MAG: indole-3-glycerol phosphate synthase TrpC [Myxococcota bacterium]